MSESPQPHLEAGIPVAKEAPRLLTETELVQGALSQFSGKIHEGKLTEEQVQTFVREKVTGVKVNGVNVISLDIQTNDQSIDPMIAAYMDSEKTKVNVIEYFEPELRANNVYSYAHPIKSLKNYGRSLLGKDPIAYKAWPQLNYAEKIADVAKDIDKPVAVMDIADRASFTAAALELRASPIAVAAALASTDIPPSNSLLLGLAAMGFTWFSVLNYQGAAAQGMYNRDQVTKFDKFVVDMEQARRMYLAKGIEQITKELEPKTAQDDPQVVALYPRAHGIRMEDMIVNPHPKTDKLKSGIYKIAAPWLNYAVRTWEYKGVGEEKTGQKHFNGWVQTAKHKITA